MRVEAAVLHGTNRPPQVESLRLDPPGAGEVLVRMGAAGICRSDHHVISGQARHEFPVVLGHEGAGVVVETGEGVTRAAPGDHVALSWIPCCGSCFFCARDETHLCKTYAAPLGDGTMPDGTCRLHGDSGPVRHLSMLACWADHVVTPQECCVVMDKAVPFDVAALLGCAVTTGVGAVLNKAGVAEGETVAVIGAGGVGLSVVMGARLAGASRIVAVDSSAAAEPRALELGATDFVLANGNAAARLAELLPHGADHVFEAVGRRALQREAIDWCRPGGRVTFVGMDAEDATIDLPTTGITRAEKTISGSIYGSARADRDFALYARRFLEGALPVDRLIGRRYRLGQVAEGIENMLAGGSGRGVIAFGGEAA